MSIFDAFDESSLVHRSTLSELSMPIRRRPCRMTQIMLTTKLQTASRFNLASISVLIIDTFIATKSLYR